MQQRSLARFMGVEDGLYLCLGGIELGKQRLNTRHKALLLDPPQPERAADALKLIMHIGASAGDVITVARGVKHTFKTTDGVVFEEISSTHDKHDSYYTDPAIAANPSRKTWLTYWM